MDYEEKVILSSESNKVNYDFKTGLTKVHKDADNGVGGILFFFIPDLKVYHWIDYVEFGFYDWFGMMAGVLSITIVAFYNIAYFVSKRFAEPTSLGMLPAMSMKFKNREEINILKMRR